MKSKPDFNNIQRLSGFIRMDPGSGFLNKNPVRILKNNTNQSITPFFEQIACAIIYY
jgi:hypothetical protein